VKRLLPAAVLAVVLLAVLAALTDLDWQRVGGTLAALDPGLTAAAFGVYAASFLGRGLRLGLLLPGAAGFVHLCSLSARHILLAVALPFRSGEASLPLMLSLEAGRKLSEGVSVLALMRVLDLLCVAAWLLVGLALGGAAGGTGQGELAPESVRARALVVFGVLAAGVLVARPLAARLAPLATSPRRVLAFAGGMAAHVAALGTRQLVAALLASLATWGCTYTACWLLLRAMADPAALGPAVDVSFAASLVGTTGLHLSAVIPVSPLAGAGTWEAGWVAGYHWLVGLSEADAMASALVSHVAIFGFIVALGALAFLLRPRAPAGAKWSG
jgi:glycosyltransferase 2 family protein